MSKTDAVKVLSPKKRELLELLLQEKERKANGHPGKPGSEPIPKRAVLSPAPLSFAQQRLWFIDQLTPGTPAFNIPLVVRLRGILAISLLHKALDLIIQRHETLRTSFSAQQGTPVQTILPSARLQVPVVDLRSVPESGRMREVQKLVTNDCQHSFDLAQPPLFRITLVLLDNGDQVLIIVMNHLIGDFWSIRLLVKELAGLYESFSASRPHSLPELPIQYADYAVYQREWFQTPACRQQVAYWKNQLAGMPEDLDLPFDHPRPAVQNIWGAKQRAKIPKATGERLRAFGQRNNASLFMTLLAGWKALLFRYTRQDDIVVGAPVANRNRSEYENVIGFFVNSVLLRTDLSGDPTFFELLARVRTMVLDAFSHQDFPFERLVEELQPARNLSRNPLYQTDIVLQNAPGGVYRVSGMTFEPLPAETGTAQLDLSLDLRDEPDGIAITLEYDLDLFERSTIARIADHYIRLLEKLAENPALCLSQVSFLARSEETQLLVDWNKTARDYDLETVYSQLFEKQARERASDIAAVCDSEVVTYEELNLRANRIAWRLMEEGVGADTIVPLLAPRDIDFLSLMLAIFKAGGAYVPLDPWHPPQRHIHVLRHSHPPVAVCARAFVPSLQEALQGLAAANPPRLLVLEDLKEGRGSGQNPPLRCFPDNLAYVIFTSGSTGVPKGAMLHHRALVNHMWATVEALEINASDIMAQTVSQCFDVSVWQFLTALVVGGRVHIFPDEIAKNPPRLLREVDRHGITIFEIVPSVLQAALSETRGPDAPKLAALRWLMCGAEEVSPQLCREWMTNYPAVPILNVYGPTECCDDVTFHQLAEPPQERDLRVPIGRPVANLQARILDRNLQLVAAGVPGEICIRGAGLARGYLAMPERTAEVFAPDPFSEGPGGRIYRTGDRGRYRADGAIEFLGRLDHQVKIHGFRIELGEIENILRNHPAVQDAVVIVREDAPGARRLTGYVVLQSGVECGTKDLQGYLKQKLPEYMVPAAYVFLGRLPLTSNGKVDRKALPAPETDPGAQEFVVARNHTEEVLAGMWEDILGAEKISVERNLFELGAHSLLVTQVASRMRKAFGVEPPLRAFFEYPTVAGMARVVEELKSQSDGLAAPPIVRIPREGNYPLSFTQESMWFLDQTEHDLTAYNVPGAVHIEGALNPVALEAGFNEILRRHEIFRTTYQTVEGGPAQVIHPPGRFDLPHVDLSALRAEDREREALRIGRENAQRPFDLLHGPVLRVFLIFMETGRRLMAMTTHHIAYDMWARELFIYELGMLYEQYVKGLPSSLEEPEIQWVDYASWLRNWMRGEVLDRQLTYWRNKLADAPPFLDLPVDFPRPPVQTFTGARLPLDLPPDAMQALKSLSRKSGVTLFIAMLTAFKTLLYRWTAEEHIVLGVPIANRNRIEVEKLIGFMANTLVFNTDLGGNPTFVELLERVRETSLGAYAHQDIPFELLVKDLQPERSLDRPAIFQVAFNYLLKYSAPSVNLSDVTLRLELLYSGATAYEIAVNVWESADGLRGLLEYRTDLFQHSTITRLVGYFRRLLENIAAGPEQRIGEISLLERAERNQVLFEWNRTSRDLPRETTVSQLIERQAGRSPHKLALDSQSLQLTYHELDLRADQLARYLRKAGVGPETAVGVCLRRSPELIVVLLAILKAGGAYLPLDPAYPAERLAFMIQDSGARVLVSDRELAGKLPVPGLTSICIDEEWPNISAQAPGKLPAAAGPENLAYIIYTSGSTGLPKGVEIHHHGLLNLITWHIETYGLTEASRVTQFANIGFDAAVWEIWPALAAGASLHIVEESARMNPAALPGWFQERRITTAFLPTPVAEEALNTHWPKGHDLRHLLTGGEKLHSVSVPFGPFRLINHYGPTECTVVSTAYVLEDGPGRQQAPPIGKPIANTWAYVLNEWMQPAPVGVAGELCVGGTGLARGYLNRPELTAEKFVPNPYSESGGERLYRTGDQVRWRADGLLEFLGRLDHQIKLRGYRIELGEIESALRDQAGVRQAVVLLREQQGDKRLVAYVVKDSPNTGSIEEELKGRLRERLPGYSIPSAFVFLDHLPLTPNGKVDHKSLPAPSESGRAASSYVAPETGIQIAVAEIFGQVLGLAKAGLNDRFFDSGGHSMLAVQVISRIRKTFLVEAPVRMMLENPSVKEVADLVQALQWAAQGAAVNAGQSGAETPVEEGFI